MGSSDAGASSGQAPVHTDLPADEDKTAYVQTMFDAIAHRYDLVNRLITFGLDRRWRMRAIADLHLARGAIILDLGCGTGDLLREASAQGLQAFGLDLSFEMLASARSVASPRVQADASALPICSGSIDGIVSGFALRNFTDQRAVIEEAARVLRPGGPIVFLEVDQPDNLLLRFGHSLWFNHAVPAIGAIFSVASAYRYLPKSITYLPSDSSLAEMLRDAGFIEVSKVRLQGGLAQLVIAKRDPKHK